MIIVTANYKGGVGKTTLAVNLAHAFKGSIKTYLVDFDPQKSLSVVESLHEQFDNEDKITFLSVKDFKAGRYAEKSMVIVDTPPYFINEFNSIFSKADYILIPTKTGLFDINNLRHILDALDANFKVGIVLNMTKASTSLTLEAIDALNGFKKGNTAIFKTQLTNRVSYIRSIVLENGIYESDDRKARAEFEAFVKELLIKITN